MVTYDSYEKSERRGGGNDFDRRPVGMSELVNLVQPYALSMRFVDGVTNVMIVQILSGQEKVATVKGVAEKAGVKIHDDLKRELPVDVKQRSLCNNIAIGTGNLSR